MINSNESSLVRIKRRYASMSDVEKKIADYVQKSPEKVINMAVSQLANTISVSEGSIIRFCQAIGLNGYTQLKIDLAQNMNNINIFIPEGITEKSTPVQAVKSVFTSTIQALKDTRDILEEEQLNRAAELLLDAERIIFFGVGSSAVVAQDAYYRFMRIGLPAYASTDPHIMRVTACRMDAKCVAVGISHTGRTIATIRSVEIAKSKGAKTICLTGFIKSPLAEESDVRFIVSSLEHKYLQEAITSRTAQIALLDGLCAYLALKKASDNSGLLREITDYLNEDRI